MNRTLLRFGFVLILFALLTGLAVPRFANPRLGLAAHMVSLVGGLLLVVLAIVVPGFALGARPAGVLRWCWAYATYASWLAAVLGAATGASRLTPLAGAATRGGPVAEAVVEFLLVSLSLAAIAGTALALWGLRSVPRDAGLPGGSDEVLPSLPRGSTGRPDVPAV
jgi:hydroxylaminobenzene mutase